MRIDAHQHFWRLARGDYGWLTPDLGPLHRDHEPEELKPLLDAAGIEGTVLVQAAASVPETRFMLELADANPWILGVVGWVDFDSPEATQVLADLAQHPRLCGLRPMVQDMADDAALLRPAWSPVFEDMRALDLCLDALIKPRHLPVLAEFLNVRPGLRVVIDHGAKPAIDQGDHAGWAQMITRLATDHPGLHCKLSGLVTEAGPAWSLDELRVYVDTLIEAFGPRRLMWGSDWPVLHLAADYAAWVEATDRLLEGLTAEERGWVLGRTAAQFYRLEEARG